MSSADADFGITEFPERTIAGVNYPLAGERPDLILYGWTKLAARLTEIGAKVNPQVLYAVWHRPDGQAATPPQYLIGVEVSPGGAVAEGLMALTIPAGRHATVRQRGHLDFGRSYDTLHQWVAAQGLTYRAPQAPTVEVYDTSQPLGAEFEVLIAEPVE
jgi:predicted transcriptional regulator YdeE